MKWIAYIWIGILLALTAISVPQCLNSGGETALFNATGQQSTLDPQGPLALNQVNIFYVTLWVTLFLFVTVGGALAFAIWKFRMRKGDDPNYVPPQSHGHPLVEMGLVVGSAALLVVIAIPTFGGILLKERPPVMEGEEVLEVNVTGYQWWWGFEYPEYGFHTANELVFPAGKVVKLNLKANDVIHSFWLPKLAGKTDLMPGQENKMWIQADEPGYFWGQCAEYCGDSHAYMLFRAKALSEDEFTAWLEQQQTATVTDASLGDYTPVNSGGADEELVLTGAELFIENCARCHSVDSKVQTMGPNLAHFGSRTSIAAGWLENESENLVHWILHPDKVKPGNFMWEGFPDPIDPLGPPQMEGLMDANLTEAQAEAIAAYLYTLK
ncbi:MAG: cytochrome c oxidase subunit II [Puniceicoccaceae bacterium]